MVVNHVSYRQLIVFLDLKTVRSVVVVGLTLELMWLMAFALIVESVETWQLDWPQRARPDAAFLVEVWSYLATRLFHKRDELLEHGYLMHHE